MRKLFLCVLLLIGTIVFAEDNIFTGKWYWDYQGESAIAPRDRYKEFSTDEKFYDWIEKNGIWTNGIDCQRYSVKEDTIVFYNESGSYRYKFVMISYSIIVLLDLEIQENPPIYCFRIF